MKLFNRLFNRPESKAEKLNSRIDSVYQKLTPLMQKTDILDKLFLAIEQNKENAVKALSKSVDINSEHYCWKVVAPICTPTPYATYRRAIFECAKHGSFESTQSIIDAGARINVKDHNGDTPLHIAIKNENTAAVCALLNSGADLTVTGSENTTPLELAQDMRKDNCIKLIYQKENETHETI